jgi:hypothetical protein
MRDVIIRTFQTINTSLIFQSNSNELKNLLYFLFITKNIFSPEQTTIKILNKN